MQIIFNPHLINTLQLFLKMTMNGISHFLYDKHLENRIHFLCISPRANHDTFKKQIINIWYKYCYSCINPSKYLSIYLYFIVISEVLKIKQYIFKEVNVNIKIDKLMDSVLRSSQNNAGEQKRRQTIQYNQSHDSPKQRVLWKHKGRVNWNSKTIS